MGFLVAVTNLILIDSIPGQACRAGEGARPRGPEAGNRRDRVSVVDDDDDAREAIASLVRSTGLEVETFASAQDFLEVAGKRLPDCLVLDVDMPGFSGLRLQEELARSNIRVPIIFVTGHGDIPTSVRAIKAGAREFFTKPFDADELLEAILAIVAHRRAGSEERARGTSGDPLRGSAVHGQWHARCVWPVRRRRRRRPGAVAPHRTDSRPSCERRPSAGCSANQVHE